MQYLENKCLMLPDGCPFSPQLKHVWSFCTFQYSLSKVIVPWRLCCLCHLYHPFEQMTILQMKLSLAQQLSCCTCRGGAVSADGSWGISCCQWWNHSLDPPWDYHVGLHSDVGRHLRCNTPQSPNGLLAFVWLTMLQKSVCGSPPPSPMLSHVL
jgi:hypothetical protein